MVNIFSKAKVGVILIANLSYTDPNFFYFSKLEKSTFHNSFLILKKNRTLLIVPKMEYNLAKKFAKCKIKVYENKDQIKNLLKMEIKENKIGIDGYSLTLRDIRALKKILKKKKFVDISKYLEEMRELKTEDEIKRIQRACLIASKVMGEVPSLIKVGKKEKEIAAEIERRMKMYGADEIAFPTIVASGKNSANSHYFAGDRRIKKGEFVLVDLGCKYKNYCSDISRTFIVGKPNSKQKEIYDTCLKMQKGVLRNIKPGISFKKLQNIANKICEKKFGKMVHGLGHGLGVEVHDPILSKKLKTGMVITVEPAIYVPGTGGTRIEDDVLVTKKGAKLLTK